MLANRTSPGRGGSPAARSCSARRTGAVRRRAAEGRTSHHSHRAAAAAMTRTNHKVAAPRRGALRLFRSLRCIASVAPPKVGWRALRACLGRLQSRRPPRLRRLARRLHCAEQRGLVKLEEHIQAVQPPHCGVSVPADRPSVRQAARCCRRGCGISILSEAPFHFCCGRQADWPGCEAAPAQQQPRWRVQGGLDW